MNSLFLPFLFLLLSSIFDARFISISNVASCDINPPTLVGATSGSFSVSDAGAATYSMPIIVSPGTGGMQPSISLSYSSSGGNGALGLGWSLLGISTIQRSGKTLAQDGVVDGVSFDVNDTYSLDGERLVLINGNFGADGSEYRTEQNVLLKITAKETTPGFASPKWFEVKTKAGLIMEYGRTNDSRIEAQGTNTIMFWCVSKIIDTKGNYMTFTYEENTQQGEYFPKRIDYTGNTSAGLQPYNSVIFNYVPRIDDTPRYVNGSKMTASKILKSIDCLHDNDFVRKYEFEYEEGTHTRISLLKRISECGTSPFDCLPPIEFTYKNEETLAFTQASSSTIPTADLNGLENRLMQGDWNGDGETDFVRHNVTSGVLKFYLNNSNFSFPTETFSGINTLGLGTLLVLDVNADGYSDLYWIDASNGNNNLYINKKEVPLSFSKTTNPIDVNDLDLANGEAVQVIPSDWNGDGRVDIMLYLASTGHNRFYRNATQTNGNAVFNLESSQNLIPQATISTSGDKMDLIPADWDNDGLTDLLWINRNTNAPQSNRFFRNTGNGVNLSFSSPIVLQNMSLQGGTNISLGDWNGDGLTDLMWYDIGNGATKWWVNKGNFTFNTETATIVQSYLDGDNLQLYPFDFNGDGASDLLIYNKPNGTNRWLLNDGKLNFSTNYLNVITPTSNIANATDLIPGAFSGKGGMDLLYLNRNASSNNIRFYETQIKPHFLLEKVVNGQGLTTTVTFKPMTDPAVYTKESGAVYPEMDFISGMLLVSTYEVDNGIGGKTKVSYTYKGARTNLRGRGFRGFTEIHQKDDVTGIISKSFYNRDHRFVGAPLQRSETRLASGQLINEADYTDTLIAYYNGKAFASHTIATESREYELDGSLVSAIKNRMGYDDYGNVLWNVTDYGDGHIDSTWNVYAGDNYTKWFLGRLTRSEMHRKAPGQPWVKRVAAFTYNGGSGLLEKEITEPDLAPELQTTKEYTHDAFGNIKASKLTFFNGDNFESRTTTTTYDTKGRFTLSISNQLGHTKTTQYDPMLGHPISETDINGLTTTYEYDPIGRLTKVNFPDGNWQTSAYENCSQIACPPNSVFSIVARSSVNPEERTFYDVLGREVETRTFGFDSTVVIKQSQFNTRGLVSAVSAPFFINQTPVWTTMTYDEIGREKEVIAPGNRITKTNYFGLITSVVNPLNQTTIVRKNVPGRVVQVTDNNNKTVNYTYDSNGNLLKTTDPNGNEIAIAYDTYGNKTTSTDPDMGTYQYSYNVIGELRQQTNPKGEVTTYKYDVLGRMIERNEPEGQTTWTYDTQANGIGMLSGVHGPGYNQTVNYDSLSRLKIQTENFGGESFMVRHYYDSKSRPKSLHYPGGFSIKYVYNNQNYLAEVRDNVSNELYWKADQINARNQLVKQTLGNGTTTENIFDNNTFWLKNIKSFSGPTKFQDLSYDYNDLGILKQRVNAVQPKTENFGYDNLNRLLTSATVGGSTLTMTYDALGNITSKSDVGDYSYGENGAGPHQLTHVQGNNANTCLPSLTTDFSFTSYNMVKEMVNDSARLEIDYSPGRSRMIQRQYLDSNLVQTKYYVGSLFERTVTDTLTRNLFYIHAMGGVVALHSTYSNGQTTNEYWHKDHLGSVQTITNQQGQVVEVLDYDAWGNRIKNTASPSTQAPYRFDRGFTGHEHLDLFSLVNMNGRVYDPVLGRFISPDPFITEPFNLQNLNRYAYVSNCPLSFTDPSGFWKVSFGGFSFGSGGFKFSGDPKDWIKGFDINGKNPLNKLIDSIDKRAAKAFGQETWNTVKVTAAAVVVGIGTGGAGTFASAILSGAASGFVGAYSGVSLAGGSSSDALKAGLKGAAIGAVTAAATYGVGDLADGAFGGEKGAFGQAEWTSKKMAVYGVKVIAHGAIQGAASEANGGKFEHGFLSGSFSAGASPLVSNNLLQGATVSAIIGGTASELGGGKFSNGAISGAMVYICNKYSHFVDNEGRKQICKGLIDCENKIGKGSAGIFSPGFNARYDDPYAEASYHFGKMLFDYINGDLELPKAIKPIESYKNNYNVIKPEYKNLPPPDNGLY